MRILNNSSKLYFTIGLIIISTCLLIRHFYPSTQTTLLKYQEKTTFPINLYDNINLPTNILSRELVASNTKYDLGNAKKMAQELLSLIYNRYEMFNLDGSQFFRTISNVGIQTWDILKYKFAYKIMKGSQSYLMIFGGSSVTAGHDNFFNASYPMIVKKRMSKILDALGIEMIVRNIAMGANNCIPYDMCYESMGGSDPDFVNWEQSYNCGRSDDMFEMTARWAGWSKEKGMIYFSSSGAWTPSGCNMSADNPPFSSEDWTPQSAGLKDWVANQIEVEEEKAMLDKFHSGHKSYNRNSGVLVDYKGLAQGGFSVWEGNPHCVTNNGTKAGCNGIDVYGTCGKSRFMTKEASTYGAGGGARWHPSTAFHMLRGEVIAWLLTLTLLDAILLAEKDLALGKKQEELVVEYKSKLDELTPDMPHPKKCEATMGCSRKMSCYTDYMPHYNDALNLSKVVVGYTNWTYDPYGLGAWSLTYGYLDGRPAYYAKGGRAAGEIHVKILINQTDYLWVCGYFVKESFKYVDFILDPHVSDSELVDYKPSGRRVPWNSKKYIGDECKKIHSLPVGQHVLSMITNDTKPEHVPGLSHVILWP